ncbi:RNA-guided endonuclease InsQ/TnpB family protein [Streptomyces sp. NPDC059456]|uniref:RNA-guided endonuclease InsQ/TnpB family protein n=1 Tax=Streptomyces sp. NPDC059456 TaxID=3346838 RepID=UPI0036CEBC88
MREDQTLVIEDPSVLTMVRNGRLARAITDAAWSELRRMLEYEAGWYERELIVVDRWFPGSKPCSHCGAVVAAMPLHVRTWTCRHRGVTHDGDGNAAISLLAAGPAASARGADGRPRRGPLPARQSAMKQEGPPAGAGIRPPREDGEAKQPTVGVSNAALPSAMPADTLRTSSQQ